LLYGAAISKGLGKWQQLILDTVAKGDLAVLTVKLRLVGAVSCGVIRLAVHLVRSTHTCGGEKTAAAAMLQSV